MSSTQVLPRDLAAFSRRCNGWFSRQFHYWSTSMASLSKKLSLCIACSCC